MHFEKLEVGVAVSVPGCYLRAWGYRVLQRPCAPTAGINRHHQEFAPVPADTPSQEQRALPPRAVPASPPTCIMLALTKLPCSSYLGVALVLPNPAIAISGWLITGLVYVPPTFPILDSVKVPFLRSVTLSLLAEASLCSRASS
jgi:hypothetical protein